MQIAMALGYNGAAWFKPYRDERDIEGLEEQQNIKFVCVIEMTEADYERIPENHQADSVFGD